MSRGEDFSREENETRKCLKKEKFFGDDTIDIRNKLAR